MIKIGCRGVNVVFNGHEFLKNVNLDLCSNEINLLYGPSGSGKTTLFNILCGLAPDPVGGGEVFWGDYEVRSLRQASKVRHRYISMIFSTFYFLESLNVEQNIMLPVVLSRMDTGVAMSRLEKIYEVFSFGSTMENLDLPGLRYRSYGGLSNGQKELVGIARGLIVDAPFIFADEMLRSFNREAEEVLWERFLGSSELGFGSERGFFMITHKEHLKDDERIHNAYRIEDKRLVLA